MIAFPRFESPVDSVVIGKILPSGRRALNFLRSKRSGTGPFQVAISLKSGGTITGTFHSKDEAIWFLQSHADVQD